MCKSVKSKTRLKLLIVADRYKQIYVHKMSTVDYLDGAYAEISATLPSTVKVAVLSRNHVKANKNIFPSI